MSFMNVRGFLFASHPMNLDVNGDIDIIFIVGVTILCARGSLKFPEFAASNIRQLRVVKWTKNLHLPIDFLWFAMSTTIRGSKSMFGAW